MLVYMAVICFFLPSLVLTPAFLKWADLRPRMNLNEFSQHQSEDSDQSEEEEEDEVDHSEMEKGSSSSSLNRCLTDKSFPSTLLTLSITNGLAWLPFFSLLLLSPLLSYVPPSITLFVSLLGYAQCLVTPILIIILLDRVRMTLYKLLPCCC